MTADEFLRLHGDESGIELINGQIVHIPAGGNRKAEINMNVICTIGNFVKANRVGRVCSHDSFVRTRHDCVRGADLLFVSYELLLASEPTPKGAISPPLDLVAEVRSPNESIGEIISKADEYLDAGVRVVLIVDPETANVGVFRPNDLPQRFHAGDILALPDVLPGFAVPVKQFFE